MSDTAILPATSSSPVVAQVASELDLQGMMTLAQSMAASGFFANAKDANKALSVMMIGREMGIGPAASLNGINVINGKPQLGATLIAAQVKKAGYDYRILEHTADVCRIEFFNRRGESLGDSSFSAKDAETAGYTRNAQYKQNPRNMLFARAMSNGAKWFAPDAFNGQTVYHEGEIEIAQTAMALERGKVSPHRPAPGTTATPFEGYVEPDDFLAVPDRGPYDFENDEAVAYGRSIGLNSNRLASLKATAQNIDWRFALLAGKRKKKETFDAVLAMLDPFSDENAVIAEAVDVEVEGGTDRGR